MLVYKILSQGEWDALDRDGESEGAPIDRADGFIHLSAPNQVVETAVRHFAGRDGLVLAALEADALGEALRWEPARGGVLFPHLHRPLLRADILWVKPLPLAADGTHRFPEDLGK